MTLNKEQETKLRQMAAEGATLGQMLEAMTQMGAQMTYMELRFAVDDLGLELKDKAATKTVPPMPSPAEASPAPDMPQENYDEMPPSAGGVTVTMDAVVRPGSMVSGEVTFSDGTKVQWALDQFGRLGLVGAPKGYQPAVTDIEEFQRKLRELIEARGGI